MAAWLVSVLSIERLLAVWIPLKAKHWTTKRNITVILIAIAIFQFGIDAHYFWTVHLVRNTNIRNTSTGYICVKNEVYRKFLSDYWPWINITFYSLIPFLILLTTSCSIIAKIALNMYMRKRNSATKDRRSKFSNLTMILLAISFTFVLTTLPVCIYRAYSKNWPHSYTELEAAVDKYRWAIVVHVNWLNNSCNVILYILLSPSFRRYLFELCRNVRITSNQNTEVCNPERRLTLLS